MSVKVRIVVGEDEISLHQALNLTDIPPQYVIAGPDSYDNPYYIASQLGYLYYKGFIDDWEMLSEYPELPEESQQEGVVY